MLNRCYLFVTLSLFLSACAGRCDPLTPAMRQEDPRLEKRITLLSPRLQIGDLLERLSRETGVSLTTGEKDGAADEEIVVLLRDAPLFEALDALWSLVSYKRAEWHWERSGEAGKYTYCLIRPLAARRLAERWKQEVQNAFETHATVMLAAAALPPEQRKKMVSQLSAALLQKDDTVANGLLAGERIWAGLKTAQEALPPDSLLSVLRGKETVKIPVNRLSDQGQAFVKNIYRRDAAQATRRGPDGNPEPIPEPQSITFYTSRFNTDISPTLFINLEGIGGYGYLGSVPMNKAFVHKMADEWRLSGDTDDHPFSQQTMPAPKELSFQTNDYPILAERLRQVSKSVPISLLARLPEDQTNDPGSPYMNTLQIFLKKLNERPPFLQHKWCGNVLLFQNPAWFWEDTRKAPWALIKQIRQREAEGQGFLRTEDLFELADRLTPEQLRHHGGEFPVLTLIASRRDLLSLCHQKKDGITKLRSDEGLPLTENVIAAVRSAFRLKELPEGIKPVAVRMTEEIIKRGDAPARQFTFGFVTAEKQWIPVQGFYYRQRSTTKTGRYD